MIFNRLLLALAVLAASCASTQQAAEDQSQATSQVAKPKMTPEQQFALHVAEVVKIIKAHPDDCDQAQTLSLAYIEKHRENIHEGAAIMQKKQEALEREEQKAYLKRLEDLVRETVPGVDKIMDEFGDRCPGKKDELGDALGLR